LGAASCRQSLGKNSKVVFLEVEDSVTLYSDVMSNIGTNSGDETGALGFGGTTNLWHNGLIEPSKKVFEDIWPFPKSELDVFYEKAFKFLFPLKGNKLYRNVCDLKAKLVRFGIPECRLRNPLIYPSLRLNSWKDMISVYNDDFFLGDIVSIDIDQSKKRYCEGIKFQCSDGKLLFIKAKYFVLAAGGVFSPLLIDKYINKINIGSFGRGYNDHPSGYVAKLKLNKPFYKLWNFPILGGWIRLPLVYKIQGLEVSFQLRPSYQHTKKGSVKAFKSVISKIRNQPFNFRLYFTILRQFDDLLEIISLKLRLNLPTKFYHVLMVTEQTPSSKNIFFFDKNSLQRKWSISPNDLLIYRQAIDHLLIDLDIVSESVVLIDKWEGQLFSSSHHSGALSMGCDNESLVDDNCRFREIKNLYISDGSIIPSTGFANTGLTIAALGLRLGEYLRSKLGGA